MEAQIAFKINTQRTNEKKRKYLLAFTHSTGIKFEKILGNSKISDKLG